MLSFNEGISFILLNLVNLIDPNNKLNTKKVASIKATLCMF